MYCAPIADARFQRHRRQRADFHFVTGETLNIQTKNMRNRFQRKSLISTAQRVMTASCFQRKITAARARILSCASKSKPCPLFKLFDGHTTQCDGAGTKTCERRFAVSLGDAARDPNHTYCEINRALVIRLRYETANKSRAAAHKSNQTRIAVLGYLPKQLEPFVKHLWQ